MQRPFYYGKSTTLDWIEHAALWASAKRPACTAPSRVRLANVRRLHRSCRGQPSDPAVAPIRVAIGSDTIEDAGSRRSSTRAWIIAGPMRYCQSAVCPRPRSSKRTPRHCRISTAAMAAKSAVGDLPADSRRRFMRPPVVKAQSA